LTFHPSEPDAGSRLRDYLLGGWSIDRTMWDRQSGTRGTFTGVVRFSELKSSELGHKDPGDDGALSSHEEGTVRWAAPGGSPFTGPAIRDYILRAADTPDALDVFFPDGRPFHRMSFTATANAQHWCDPDTYRVKYILVSQDEFRYTWDVNGPAKDLLLESVLRRMDEPGSGEQQLGSEA
jgi:hypothetical protein